MTAEGEQSPEVPAPVAKVMSTSGSEGLLLIGALAILGGWLIFEVIASEYTAGATPVVLAAWALVVLMNDSGMGPVSKSTVLKVLGYTVALFGAREIIADLRTGLLDDIGDWLGALIFYAGAALMFVGARGIKTD